MHRFVGLIWYMEVYAKKTMQQKDDWH